MIILSKKEMDKMRITGYEILHCNAGCRDFSFLLIYFFYISQQKFLKKLHEVLHEVSGKMLVSLVYLTRVD